MGHIHWSYCNFVFNFLFLISRFFPGLAECHLEVAQEVIVGYIEMGNYDGSPPRHTPIVIGARLQINDVTKIDEVNRQVGLSVNFM